MNRGRSPWVAACIAVMMGAAGASRRKKLAKVAPELRSAALVFSPEIAGVMFPVMRVAMARLAPFVKTPAGVERTEFMISAAEGRKLRVVALHRKVRKRDGPAMLWFHGGGYVMGTPEIDLPILARILEALDITIFSVDYRLAPQHPYPAGLDDGFHALKWVLDEAGALGVDAERVAIGGGSAGGGLAAALVQRASDAGLPVAFQLLIYPMLDDRTAMRTAFDGRGELIWTSRSNREAWTAYLGNEPGQNEVGEYAAPARRRSLAGLPPAWVGVGSLDLFHDEDVTYAERLNADGSSCKLCVVEDAPHGFDGMSLHTRAAKEFHHSMIEALAAAIGENAG